MREIAFDTETTGLHWNEDDRIIEVGAVELVNYVPTGNTFQAYINPGRSVSEDTIRITGITDADLAGRPGFEDPSIVDRLLDFFGDARIIAHNAKFDQGFLNMELRRCGRDPIPDDRWLDSAALARERFPGSPVSLDALCKRFNVDNEARTFHGALLDSQLLAEVYLELNGGRARAFEFLDTSSNSGRGSKRSPARQRPSALPSRLSDEEKARHKAFVQAMGEGALWLKG